MGRTNPTYRKVLRNLSEEWQPYRRALRLEDQNHFDELLEQAEQHADAAGYLNHDDPVIPFLVSILLEQEKRIADLEEQC